MYKTIVRKVCWLKLFLFQLLPYLYLLLSGNLGLGSQGSSITSNLLTLLRQLSGTVPEDTEVIDIYIPGIDPDDVVNVDLGSI